MYYQNLIEGTFRKRPNRFIAMVEIDGQIEKCHVKNTGRLGELLLDGAKVGLEPSDDPNRKTKYSLISVYKDGNWVNIDSQIPNKLAKEWISSGGWFEEVSYVKSEKTYGKSRFDLYVEADGEKWFIEVKGVTLNDHGVAKFPDAPTERGLKHVEELIRCRQEGYRAGILFVIQMKDIKEFRPFRERQPEFAHALLAAKKAGVEVRAMDCIVKKDFITIDSSIPVVLE